MPRRPLEDLPAVPGQVFGVGMPLGALRPLDGPAVMPHQAVVEAGVAVGVFRDEEASARLQDERPQVEQLVVQHAQGQTVPLLFGASGR